MSNYLYVIRCNDRFKIGIASDVNARLASLQTGNPYQLSVVYCYEFDNAFPVEQSLHQKFICKGTVGEWFALEVSDLDELIEICTLLGGKPVLGNATASEDDIQEAEVIGEIASESRANLTHDQAEKLIGEGWRVEPKMYKNKDGSVRLYYVLRRIEERNGKTYKPSIYLGKDHFGLLEE